MMRQGEDGESNDEALRLSAVSIPQQFAWTGVEIAPRGFTGPSTIFKNESEGK